MRFSLYPALIRSDARLSYGEADGILIDYKAAIAAGGDIAWRLVECSRLARARRRPAPGPAASTRHDRGQVILDAEGRPTDIALRRKTDATRLVEEAMIWPTRPWPAYRRRGFPCLYRVHEPPASDALGSLIPVFRSSIGSKKGPWRRGWWQQGSKVIRGDFGGKRAPQRGGACPARSAAGHEKGRLPAGTRVITGLPARRTAISRAHPPLPRFGGAPYAAPRSRAVRRNSTRRVAALPLDRRALLGHGAGGRGGGRESPG